MSNPAGKSEPLRDSTVEVPKPTVWPMVLSLSLALTAAGAALGSVVFAALGGLLFVISLWGWFGVLLSGKGHEREAADRTRAVAGHSAARNGRTTETGDGRLPF